MTTSPQILPGRPRTGLTRTMVVWCPDWPVIAAATAAGCAPDAPVAVLAKGRVLASSAAARAEGVRRGLRARDAQSRCPELVVLKYDPVVDARAFDPVVSCLEALTPGVQLVRPGMCALKARGPSRFYGSESAAAEKLLDRLETFDVPGSRVGIADGPFAAEQAARSSSAETRVLTIPEGGSAAFLAGFAVDVLEQPTLTDLLRRLGLRSLGAFARLPATEVLTRFGPDGAFAHRLARGYDDRPVVARQAPPELARTLDFEPAVDRVDQVAFAVRGVADGLVAHLTSLGLVCTTLRVEVGTESGRVHEREWLHPRWFSAADLVDRVRWQLQGTGTATSELTSSVVRVRLVPAEVDPVGAHVDGLWGGGPDERIHRALTRVQSMLGHGAVASVVVGGGRGPAERQTLVPWGDRPAPALPPDLPWPGSLPAPAPATIYPVPRPAMVLAADGRSVSVSARGVLSGDPAGFRVEPVPGSRSTDGERPSDGKRPSDGGRPSDGERPSGGGRPSDGERPAGGGRPSDGERPAGGGRPSGGEQPSDGGRQVSGGRRTGAGRQVGERPQVGPWQRVAAWAGPWPVEERWWDADAENRLARFQIVGTDGRAWLFAVRNGHWWVEASYD